MHTGLRPYFFRRAGVNWVPAFHLLLALYSATGTAEPWVQHTIDDTLRGADGVRLGDVNGDGLPDIATPWEESGVVRVYLHPGYEAVMQPWPAVTVGNVPTPEDAVFVDLDKDRATDVVTSCEGEARSVYVHWAPSDAGDYRDAGAWRTEVLPASRDLTQWMYCLPADMDGDGDTDLVMGAKNENAQVGFFMCPDDPRDLGSWRWQAVYDAGWVMSIERADVDDDGVADILISDRRGPTRGVLWLKPSTEGGAWHVERIGPVDQAEMMFLWGGQFVPGGAFHVVVGAKQQRRLFHFTQRLGGGWAVDSATIAAEIGDPKSVAIADLDFDGRRELILSCEAGEDALGLVTLDLETLELAHDIGGTKGNKFDRIELVDVDGDGDLDVLTCEERTGLGVVWYENPRY